MKGNIEKLTYILFILSNFIMFFNPGVYWDDWAIYNMDAKGIMNQFYGNGVIPVGYMHVYFQRIWASPHLYHILSFLLQFIQIFTLFQIAKKYPLKEKYVKFILLSILIFAVFPHYDSKITMIVFPYTLCLTFFIVATYFLIRFISEKNLMFRVLSLVFFFLSFFTNSLLFFYMIPVFFVFFFDRIQLFRQDRFKNKGLFFKHLLKRIGYNLDFFILPFLFWAVRLMFFMPSMHYDNIGYNEIKSESLLEVPYRFVKWGYTVLTTLYPLVIDFIRHPEFWLLLLLVSLMVWKFTSKWSISREFSSKLLVWGVVILVIGLFPYLLVNKFPSYVAYFTRHQLLIGFGMSLILAGIILLIRSQNLQHALIAAILGVMVSFNVFIHYSYFKGYMKNQVLHNYFSQSGLSSDIPQTILYNDRTADFTVKGNPVKFYALSGILKQSNSNENIMIIRERDLNKYLEINLFDDISNHYYQYNLTNYEYTDPSQELVVGYSKEPLPRLPFVSFLWDHFSGEQNKWSKYFEISLQPINNRKSASTFNYSKKAFFLR